MNGRDVHIPGAFSEEPVEEIAEHLRIHVVYVGLEQNRLVTGEDTLGLADADAEHAVSLPAKGTGEPSFRDARDSGQRQHILPGNRHFSPGDRMPKPGQGGGAGSAPGQQSAEDDFRFVLSREEVLDLFFEDLELPDMVKLSLKEILSFKPRRAGFSTGGSPTNINIARTMRNSHGRRIALQRPKRAEV